MELCLKLNGLIGCKYRKWLALFFAIIEMVAFGGYYYGFNALVPSYKALGVFNSSCGDTDCSGQDKMFSYAFTTWTVTQMCLITGSGYIMDRLGLRFLKIISTIAFSAGTLMFAFADGENGGILFPGGILVALGSTSGLSCNIQVSSMFSRIQGFSVALICGAFDSATVITFLVSKTAPKIPLRTSFIIIACSSLLVGLFMALLILTQWSSQMNELRRLEAEEPSLETGSEHQRLDMLTDPADHMRKIINDRYPSLKKCILSLPFCLSALWIMFGVLRFSYFLSQMEQQLNYMVSGDKERVGKLQEISSAILMAGLLLSPVSGFVLDISRAHSKKKLSRKLNATHDEVSSDELYWTHIGSLVPAYLLTAISALIYSLIIYIRHEEAFYVAMIILVMMRSLLFSTLANFTLSAFPSEHFGSKLNGLIGCKYRKWLALFLAIIEMVAFGGYYYGFNALVPSYKALGVFNSSCGDKDCSGQDKMFSYAFTTWTVTQMCLITGSGYIMDRLGLRFLKIISTLAFSAGTLMFAFADGENGGILFPGGILVALGSTSGLICNLQISSMFPRIQGLTISLISGSFDSATVITYVISKTAPEIPLRSSFIIISCGSLLLGSFMALFILTQRSSEMAELCELEPTAAEIEPSEPESIELNGNRPLDTTLDPTSRIQRLINGRYPSLKKCILSLPFSLTAMWIMFGFLRFSYFLSQMEQQLNYMVSGDKERVGKLQEISSAVLMAGLLLSPVSGFVLDISRAHSKKKLSRKLNATHGEVSSDELYWTHVGSMAPAYLLMAISALSCSLVIYIRHEEAFYIATIFLVLMRSLLFSASVNFILTAFPLERFGTINGLINTMAGIFGLLQNAMLQLGPEAGNGVGILTAEENMQKYKKTSAPKSPRTPKFQSKTWCLLYPTHYNINGMSAD
ncbi:unnamed protein product [Calicophoron daubneyi]|uniref:Solute carrier family 43 member 3 n=1 Tax=Calicophoron daubneyi TaxID=300641 RepID=A0AAV2U183_CALDB